MGWVPVLRVSFVAVQDDVVANS
jgi:hypothetical protein